jgi:hypothetical protein
MMDDIQRMRDAVFFEGPEVRQRLSRFWILIVLASIIAAAGIAADSTATVIGAMIVAPLMIPILGTMLSVVLADRSNLIRSLLLLACGAITAIAIGCRCTLEHFESDAAKPNGSQGEPHCPRQLEDVPLPSHNTEFDTRRSSNNQVPNVNCVAA